MGELNLENLKKYKDEILKAEITSLLALWEKINPGKQNKSQINIIKKFLSNWEYIIRDKKLKILEEEIDLWNDFLNNWRNKWRSQKDNKYLLQVLYGIGESLNSGIDKGFPDDNAKLEPENDRWLSNSFGSFKNKIIYLSLDKDTINNIISNLECYIKNFLDSESINWDEIKLIKKKIKNLYYRLLSDDRFPINDVSLWEQAYMATTMFKASLSEYILKNNNIQSLPKRMDVRWRILGIQYDKLRLAEKGYKPQQIQWYREVSNEIDDEIKKLLEYDYPIGNEIYRDETGVYFLVGEDLGEDLKNGNSLVKLSDDLEEIKDKIIKIFKDKSFDEFYPAIFLTKPSRGIMNLTHLLEAAKENFLKVDLSKKGNDICIERSNSVRAVGICQVCGQRLVFERDKSDENKNICDICLKEKTQGRIERWFKNRDKETIWIDELKDKNDKIALITMKFELHDWLNGDMLNSLLVREKDFNAYFSMIKDLLNLIKSELSKEELESLEIDNTAEDKINKFLLLYDAGGIYEPFNEVYETLKKNKNIDNVTGRHKDLVKRLLVEDWIEDFSFFDKSSRMITINKKKNKSIQDSLQDNNAKGHLYKIFAINYLILQIYNTLLERSIGDRWEEFICERLEDKDKNQGEHKIDFDKRKIYWNNLNDSDIEFLSTLILQFLFRKNPSPARLRRIWESTKEFLEEIKSDLCASAGIEENRRKRFYWENVKVKNTNENIPDGEYQDGDALFWADKGKVYLISYINDLKAGKEFNLKESTGNGNVIASVVYTDNTKFEYYQPYISIIEPTPISWQFIIPAEYVPNLIDNVMKKYYENFKFVYGKLPLHIGIVVQDYKKPLYVGVKALRKIKRDVEDTEKLTIEVKASKIKDILKCQKIEESLNNTHKYYSLYWGNHSKGYKFYIKPEDRSIHCILDIDEIGEDEEINIIPNTFDFEFLDTNTRRNDIYYDGNNKWKRKIKLKSSRPYNLDNWEKFKKFKDLFGKENKNGVTRSTKLQKLISVIYDNWKAITNDESKINSNVEGIKAFLASSFINILDLKKDIGLADGIKDLFDIDKSKENDKLHAVLKEKMTLDNVQLFLDMFEFWHTTLKEV